MEAKDLTTHLSIASAVLVMAAVVPFSTQNLPKFIYGMAAGVALMALNWLIGSNWAVALSEMALPKGNAKYLATLNDAFHFDWGNPSDGCAVGIGYYLLPIIMLGLTWLVYRAAQVVIDAGLY